MTAGTAAPITTPPQTRNLRLDIEGLRAIAIGLVLVFHAGLPLTGGFIGVDVFFVLSGFLITGILIRELEKTQRISLARFYARRAKRLLPATGLVLITTAVLTWLTVSSIDWRTFGWDIVAAATYVVNWALAGRSVDYLAEDVGASPVQHFWSLAVEEQFYIVWPLLLLLVAWWYRKRGGTHLRERMFVGILLIALPSLIFSIYYTGISADKAFFITPTRLWEMAVGALVAIGANLWPRISRVGAEALGWGGIAAILAGAILINPETPWPSYWALVPTVGSAAVIMAGFTPETSCSRLLSIRPAVWVGGLSYSLYLWHWPLLIAADAYWEGLTAARGVAVVALSFLPAYLSYRFIENPIRFAPSLSKSNPLALSVGLNFSLIGATAGLVLVLAVNTSTFSGSAGESGDNGPESQALGAAALDVEYNDGDHPAAGTVESLADVEWFIPAAVDATKDLPAGYANDCQVDQVDPNPRICEYGDLDGDIEVAIVGDSKILQYMSAWEEIGERHGIHFFSYTKSACAFSSGVQQNKGDIYRSCTEWNRQVLKEVLELEPDAVFTASRVHKALSEPTDPSSTDTKAMADAITDVWKTLSDAGIPVVGLVDNPVPDFPVYECVADEDRLEDCAFDKKEAIQRSSAAAFKAANSAVPTSELIDIRDHICPDAECVPVIGNVLVYRQTSHLTDTYVRTLIPILEEQLVPAIQTVMSR